MKKRALQTSAVALTAIIALVPAFNVAAVAGDIDYGGNINQIDNLSTENYMVTALSDGGYVVAGVTENCHRTSGYARSDEFNTSDNRIAASRIGSITCFCGTSSAIEAEMPLAEQSDPLQTNCGYVARYKNDGTKVWQTNMPLAIYPALEVPSDYYYNDETSAYELSYETSAEAMPFQLKETSNGIGLITGQYENYFLFNKNSGEISNKYSLVRAETNVDNDPCTSDVDGGTVQLCQDPYLDSISPKMAHINDDGSVTIAQTYDSKIERTNDGKNYTTITTNEDKVWNFLDAAQTKSEYYVSECDSAFKLSAPNGDSSTNAGEMARGSCDLYRYDESLTNRQKVDFGGNYNNVFPIITSDDILMVSAHTDEFDEEDEYVGSTGGIFFVKNAQPIAQMKYDSSEEPTEAMKEFDDAMTELMGDGPSRNIALDMVQTKSGVAVVSAKKAVEFDKNLNVVSEVDLESSNDAVVSHDVAFLRDGSVVVAGADVNESDYYDVDGEQNGVHVHYGSVISPLEGEDTPNDIENPNTIDNVTLFGIDLVAIASCALLHLKRYGRR